MSLALLVVLDTLSPSERLAFVLHDMFHLPYEEIAPMVERSPEAARQLASRARRRLVVIDRAHTINTHHDVFRFACRVLQTAPPDHDGNPNCRGHTMI